MKACQCGSLTVVSALLKQGAQVDLQNNVSKDSFDPILGSLVV